ncbi:MAG: hypothetical protein M1815_001778 [Lichina confinis]|nr:MAG: hypothetical protein M1815_001778 [Lichina confinis]
MNPAVSTTSTTDSSNARPRNRRLKPSIDDDGSNRNSGDEAVTHASSVYSSPLYSRTASPMPRSATSSSIRRANGDVGGARTSSNGLVEQWHASRRGQQPESSLVSGLWGSSWSAIQGLASNVLSADAQPTGKAKGSLSDRQRRRDATWDLGQNRWLSGASGPVQWGPKPVDKGGEDAIAAGTRASREALVRAKRRDGLLIANEEAVADATGRFTSPSQAPSTAREQQVEDDELVYLHHVKPEDTVAGLILRFHCQPVVFRKANRLWPNDPIQTRKTILLPVHACGVKGRPVPPRTRQNPESQSDIKDEQGMWGPAQASSSSPSPYEAGRGSEASSNINLPELDEGADDPPWRHESWVMIDGRAEPVEIVRMRRKTLGYFPPRRRKSRSSDVDSVSMSLDLPRASSVQSRGSKNRSRSTSYFAQHLHGPGGVGALGAGIRSPGPGQDGLNRYLGPHLTGPRDSFESAGSNVSTGLENVGSAIEGWVKRVASRAAATLAENAGGIAGCRASMEGDLIELSDGLDPGGSDDRHGLSRRANMAAETTTRADYAGDADIERALRERFPMRGPPREHVGDESMRKKGN